MLQFVKASEVVKGDEIVIRSLSGRIEKTMEVAEVGRTCSDFSQVHISLRAAPRFKDSKHDTSLKSECWFQDSEIEVKRGE